MTFYDALPPAAQTREDVHPTLLVCWWCSIYALIIILARIIGRWTRTRNLLREDGLALLSIIPLFARIGFVHNVLLLGTNNVMISSISSETVSQRQLGSQLLLAARICFVTYLWCNKIAALEVIRKIIGVGSSNGYRTMLKVVYAFMAATYLAAVISTLAECHPFNAYWQVIPDPGPKCRQGSIQLVCVGVADGITDLVVIALPIPLVVSTTLPRSKKALLILLFSLPMATIAVSLVRIPTTMFRKGAQPYRSLMASIHILVATGITNAIAIGSFIRDKGPRRNKYRSHMVELYAGSSKAESRT